MLELSDHPSYNGGIISVMWRTTLQGTTHEMTQITLNHPNPATLNLSEMHRRGLDLWREARSQLWSGLSRKVSITTPKVPKTPLHILYTSYIPVLLIPAMTNHLLKMIMSLLLWFMGRATTGWLDVRIMCILVACGFPCFGRWCLVISSAINPYKPSVPLLGHRQTVHTQIRRRRMQRLIRVFTVCKQDYLFEIE